MNSHYPTLFSPLTLAGHRLRNRLVHAAIVTRYVRDGRATETLLNYYRSRARGGTGMIVTEPIAMTQYTRVPSRLRAWDDTAMDSLKQCADAVESEDCRLLGQLQDSGRGRHEVGRNDDAVGASALPDDLSWTVPRVLTGDDIKRMIDDWALGSQRLQRAGFSGVELSAGHGHLFHQFLSPWSNRRTDEYGGDLEGRTRFLRELMAAIRDTCGSGFIIGLKLPGDDGVNNSLDLGDAAKINDRLAQDKQNFDYWTWVWGAHANSLHRHLPDAHGERHPYLESIKHLRQADPDIVSGAIGYMTDPNECEAALTDGTADLAFLGRPLITDPAFAQKAAAGRESEIRYCVSCNTCWRSIIDGTQLACDNNPRVGRLEQADWRSPPPPRSKKIVVIGAGIAGLEAALTAAQIGHSVVVIGRGDEPGGKTRLHAALPGGENLSSIYDFQTLRARQLGVTFHLGTEATLDHIVELEPDQVLLATGSTPRPPEFFPRELIDAGFVSDAREMARDLLSRTGSNPGQAVLYDHDHTEMTYAVAELLAQRFEAVTLVTPRERFASDVSLINRQGIYQRLHHQGVQLVTCSVLDDFEALESGRLSTRNIYNNEKQSINDVAAITYSSPRVPNDELAKPLRDYGIEVITIGDCRAPRSVLAATREGHEIALSL